ncbi:hypothetical protein MRX96_021633 [Rhipicephalus microplus]
MHRHTGDVPARHNLKFKMTAMYLMACILVLALGHAACFSSCGQLRSAYRQLGSSAKASSVPSVPVPSSGFNAGHHPPVSVVTKQLPLLKTADEAGADEKDKLIATMENKLRDLEARIQKLEKNAPKTFPIVQQLDYREKKRILGM